MSRRTLAHHSTHGPQRVVLGTALCALVLAGCSSGGKDEPSAAASGKLTDESLATIAAYTGSELGAADTSLEPVTWGYVNQEGGAISFPQYTAFTEALVDVVNNELGGIGGHPLELDVCHVVSADEEGQTCAQQFASNDKISAILELPLINGNAAFHRVIDPTGIPVFGSTANGPEEAVAPTSFFMSGPQLSTVPIITGYVIENLKPKSVAVIGIEGNPISQMISGEMKTTLEGAGIEAKLAAVPQTSTDATAPLVAAGVKDADAIVALLNGASLCASVATSLTSLDVTDTPVVTVPGCSDQAVADALGDFPKWTYIDGLPSTVAPALDDREAGELAVAKDLWKATGSEEGYLIYAGPTVQTFLTTLALVNGAGGADATKETTIATAKGFTGPLFLGPETVGWGSLPMAPAVASLEQRLYTYQGDDTWVDAADGWFAPAAG